MICDREKKRTNNIYDRRYLTVIASNYRLIVIDLFDRMKYIFRLVDRYCALTRYYVNAIDRM